MSKSIKIYKSENSLLNLTVLDELTSDIVLEPKIWIDISEPTSEILDILEEKTKIPSYFLYSSLDEEESARIDKEDDNVLIVLDVPYKDKQSEEISTKPFIITYNKDYFITISCYNDTLINSLVSKTRNLEPQKKARLTLNLIYQLSREFIYYLKKLDYHTKIVEEKLHDSMKNQEIFELMDINKTLVYFSNALTADKAILTKLLKSQTYKRYDEDFDLMEDTEVEINQAIEMCTIYRGILANTTDAFASIISNNLNIVMKSLTVITIVISIPTLVSSIYGMNFNNLPLSDSPYGFYIILAISLVLSIIAAIILIVLTRKNGKKKK